MKNYQALIRNILTNGEERQDRTGVGTLSVFSPEPLRFDLSQGFPLLTLKKVSFKNILVETIWFLSGRCYETYYLKENNVTIWDEWADEFGFLGRIYGVQWREWYTGTPISQTWYDQIAKLIDDLKNNPTSRRHLVSSWNVGELDQMALPPCHWAFQCYVTNGKKLNLKVICRSTDIFIGCPYNIGNYAIITHILANICGLSVGELIVDIGDAHLYLNHIEQAQEILRREEFPLPKLEITKQLSLQDLTLDFDLNCVKLHGYQSHPAIKADVAV